jgi:hypothetical protein
MELSSMLKAELVLVLRARLQRDPFQGRLKDERVSEIPECKHSTKKLEVPLPSPDKVASSVC